jgi:hypothetical protein
VPVLEFEGRKEGRKKNGLRRNAEKEKNKGKRRMEGT